jgi:hypothetical protein
VRQHAELWDWLYGHHAWLIAALVVAVLVTAVVGWSAWRGRRLSVALVGGAGCLALVVVTILGWVLADQRSNDRDIARRVDTVASTLPSSAHQVGHTSGSNFRVRTFRLTTDRTTTLGILGRSLTGVPGGHTSRFQPAGVREPDFTLTFAGRNGCDGTVEVAVSSKPAATGETQVSIEGECED